MKKGGASSLISCLLIFIYVINLSLPSCVLSVCLNNKKPVVFNFGDSNSDTGGFCAALGYTFGTPNGRKFFLHPSGRISDGRLILDFICESLGADYLTPYLESLDPNFKNGANFAISGSSTLPNHLPFSLDVQVLQFLRFRTRSLDLSKGNSNYHDDEELKNALFIIDIGQNDIIGSFFHLSYPQVIEKIPSFINEIRNAILSLYQSGGKNFWVHNTGPIGCLPAEIVSVGRGRKSSDFDPVGCVKILNDVAIEFNHQLLNLCEELRHTMPNTMIVYVDIYSIKYDLIANSAQFGFENPLTACCGHGGPPYNFNGSHLCGQPGSNVCKEDSKHINWDGTHYTEAANAFVASYILSANYSTPKVNIDFFCNA